MTNDFQPNDIVSLAKATPGFEFGRPYKVRDVSPRGSVIKLEGRHGSFSAHRFSLVNRPAPVKQKVKPKGILVETDAVMAALTKFVKDEFGIDAAVHTVVEKFENALMLVFKEEAVA